MRPLEMLAQATDRATTQAAYPAEAQASLTLMGRVTFTDAAGNVLHTGQNKVTQAGLGAIVDALQSASSISNFKYIGFGTASTTATSAQTALGAECTGGTYARLIATQKEGANARVYRCSGTWTNNCAAQQLVAEIGIFNASTGGTMLARYATTGTGVRTVPVSGQLYTLYDITLAG